jgi:hypothetical protein
MRPLQTPAKYREGITIWQVCQMAVLVFVVLLCLCAWRAYGLLGDIRKDVGGLTSQVSTTLAQMNSTQKDASAKFAEEQKQLGDLVVASKHIVQRTDLALFGKDLKSGLFGQARDILANSNQFVIDSDVTVKAQNTSLLDTQTQIRTSLFQFSRDSSATLDQSKTLFFQLSQDASDPSIPKSFANFEQTTRNTARITSDGAATMADVRTGVHYELQQLMKPVNKVYTAAKIVATIAGKFLGL